MNGGGLSDERGQGRRETSPSSSVSGARLLALGASIMLHLGAIAALASLHNHIAAQSGRGTTLTVFSLQAPAPIPERKPNENPPTGEGPARVSAASPPAARVPASAAPIVSSNPAILPPLAATGEPVAPAVPRPDEGPRPPAADVGSALRAYQLTIWRTIDAHRPRGINRHGTVLIAFRLSTDGALLSAEISRTSGDMLLDKIALRSVRQASPFPRPPEAVPAAALLFSIEINFH